LEVFFVVVVIFIFLETALGFFYYFFLKFPSTRCQEEKMLMGGWNVNKTQSKL